MLLHLVGFLLLPIEKQLKQLELGAPIGEIYDSYYAMSSLGSISNLFIDNPFI